MLDIKYIKENPDEVIARLAKKGKDAKAEIEQILALDAERRALIAETESIKAEQNKINKLIPQYKKEGKDVAPIFEEMKQISEKTKELDGFIRDLDEEIYNIFKQKCADNILEDNIMDEVLFDTYGDYHCLISEFYEKNKMRIKSSVIDSKAPQLEKQDLEYLSNLKKKQGIER